MRSFGPTPSIRKLSLPKRRSQETEKQRFRVHQQGKQTLGEAWSSALGNIPAWLALFVSLLSFGYRLLTHRSCNKLRKAESFHQPHMAEHSSVGAAHQVQRWDERKRAQPPEHVSYRSIVYHLCEGAHPQNPSCEKWTKGLTLIYSCAGNQQGLNELLCYLKGLTKTSRVGELDVAFGR